MKRQLPKDVEDFINQYIKSVAQIEILSLPFKFAEREWTSALINQELRGSLTNIQSCLDRMVSQGLVEQGPPHIYKINQQNSEAYNRLSLLLSEYESRRVAIIEYIYTKPLNPIQNLADAFRLRKGD